MAQELVADMMKCPTCGGSGEKWVDDVTDPAGAAAEAMGDVPACPACRGTGFVPHLDPVKEAENAKTVINRMSGREPCYFVYAKLHGKKGAVARVFLGSLPILPLDELAKEAKRQWPWHWKDGMKLVRSD